MNADSSTILTRRRRRQLRACKLSALLVFAASTLGMVSGCSWWRSLTGQDSTPDTIDARSAQIATSRPATTQITNIDVAPVPPNLAVTHRAVTKGALPGVRPLVYLVEGNSTLRVRNINTDEEIVRFSANAGQIVRVDLTGVYLANKPVIGANLAPGDYAIEILPDVDGIRSIQLRTAPPSQ